MLVTQSRHPEVRPRLFIPTCPVGMTLVVSSVEDAFYGVTTGQAVAPLVVQVIRPWIDGLSGEFAVT